MDHGFAPGQEQGGDLVGSEIFDYLLHLNPIELAGVVRCCGIGITMYAAEVASAGDIPNHDGASLSRALCRFKSKSIPQAVGWLRCSGPEFCQIYHWDSD